MSKQPKKAEKAPKIIQFPLWALCRKGVRNEIVLSVKEPVSKLVPASRWDKKKMGYVNTRVSRLKWPSGPAVGLMASRIGLQPLKENSKRLAKITVGKGPFTFVQNNGKTFVTRGKPRYREELNSFTGGTTKSLVKFVACLCQDGFRKFARLAGFNPNVQTPFSIGYTTEKTAKKMMTKLRRQRSRKGKKAKNC